MPALTVQQLALLCNGKVEGNGQLLITGANTIEAAGSSEITFAESRKATELALQSTAGCLIVPASFGASIDSSLIRVDASPRLAFVQVVKALYSKPRPSGGIHATAIVSPSAVLGADCKIGPYSVVGENARVGERCLIGVGCAIGAEVEIGDDSTLHDNVNIYEGVRMGRGVTLHSGCVIGADGFGFTLVGDRYEKFPQVGTVVIGNDVEVGAHSCIDRAALGATQIGDGTKLDNLVHVAHNCILGKHVVVAAQTGFSGSVTVGDYAVIGGQVGVADKAAIASKAVVGAQAGIVTGQRIDAGEPVWGTPARPIRQYLKGLAHVGKLSANHEQMKKLEKRLAALEATFGSGDA